MQKIIDIANNIFSVYKGVLQSKAETLQDLESGHF